MARPLTGNSPAIVDHRLFSTCSQGLPPPQPNIAPPARKCQLMMVLKTRARVDSPVMIHRHQGQDLFVPEGSVSAIALAITLMLMPQAALAQSVATAAMPTLAAQYARGNMAEFRSSLAASLRGILVLSIPASLGLILLRQPLIMMLYQRGAFDQHSTELVSWALLWYAAGLVGHCLVEVLARSFYAMHDTRTPVVVGAGAMGLNVGFSILFSAWFTRLGWMPHGGLALANSLATALEAGGLLYLMRRRLAGLEGTRLLQGAWQAGLAALGMGAALWVWLDLTSDKAAWLVALGGVVLGSAVYGLVVLGLGMSEARWALAWFGKAIRRIRHVGPKA